MRRPLIGKEMATVLVVLIANVSIWLLEKRLTFEVGGIFSIMTGAAALLWIWLVQAIAYLEGGIEEFHVILIVLGGIFGACLGAFLGGMILGKVLLLAIIGGSSGLLITTMAFCRMPKFLVRLLRVSPLINN